MIIHDLQDFQPPGRRCLLILKSSLSQSITKGHASIVLCSHNAALLCICIYTYTYIYIYMVDCLSRTGFISVTYFCLAWVRKMLYIGLTLYRVGEWSLYIIYLRYIICVRPLVGRNCQYTQNTCYVWRLQSGWPCVTYTQQSITFFSTGCVRSFCFCRPATPMLLTVNLSFVLCRYVPKATAARKLNRYMLLGV